MESYHDQTLGCDRYRIAWERQGKVLPELAKWCAPEIFEAVGTDPAGRALCDLWVDKDDDAKKYRLVGNLGLVEQGLQRAVRAVLDDLVVRQGGRDRHSSDPKWLHSFFAVEDPDEWVKPVPDLSEP